MATGQLWRPHVVVPSCVALSSCPLLVRGQKTCSFQPSLTFFASLYSSPFPWKLLPNLPLPSRTGRVQPALPLRLSVGSGSQVCLSGVGPVSHSYYFVWPPHGAAVPWSSHEWSPSQLSSARCQMKPKCSAVLGNPTRESVGGDGWGEL
jgi:hypothetical protein